MRGNGPLGTRRAVQAQGPVWTEVYTSISAVEGRTLWRINASRPIYDPGEQTEGGGQRYFRIWGKLASC